jgi:hypothetical protein
MDASISVFFKQSSDALSSLRFAGHRRFSQCKEYDLFAGDGADVVVHADDLDAGDFPDQLLHERSSCLEKMFAYLLEQIAPFFGRQRFDQVLFGGSEYAMKANKDNVVDQVGANVLGTPAHVFLTKATDPFGDGRFDFSLRFHGDICLEAFGIWMNSPSSMILAPGTSRLPPLDLAYLINREHGAPKRLHAGDERLK